MKDNECASHMKKLSKLRKDRKTALKKLDDAMDACMPEMIKMSDIVKKSKNKFLSSYKEYKNGKISDHDFLQITDSFAETIQLEKNMFNKFSKILEPLEQEFQKRCKNIYIL